MKDNKKDIAIVVASADVFDFLKEKVGERKTRTEAYCDLLVKSLAGFVSEFICTSEQSSCSEFAAF